MPERLGRNYYFVFGEQNVFIFISHTKGIVRERGLLRNETYKEKKLTFKSWFYYYTQSLIEPH